MVIKRTFFLALLLLLLSACAPAASDQVEIVPVPEEIVPQMLEVETELTLAPFALAYYPEHSLNPAYADHRANLNLAGLLYEGLFQLSESFMATPLLCQSYTTSSDGLVWTFTIREGITFSDGTPLTAQLVANSLSASAKEGSRYASRLSAITRFEASENTLTLTLSAPNNNFMALLDVPITLEDEENPLAPLGTGRYVLDAAEERLVPTANYWQSGQSATETIDLHAIRYTDDLVAAFDAGYVSLVDVDLLATQAPYFSSSYQVWDYPTSGLVYLAFNTREGGDSPCTSVQLRHIVALTVDRSTIVSQDFAQHAVAATLPIHPASPYYDVLLAATGDYSPAVLSYALEEFTPLDEPLQLLVSNENAARLSTAQRIVDGLNGAGVSTQLVSLPWDDYLLALEAGEFDLYLAETQLTADFDLTPLIGTGGALNYGGYASAATDQWLSYARSSPATTQSAAATRLYTQILEDTPLVPICFKNGSVLTQWGRVSQLTATQSNPFYQLERWEFQQ